MQYRLVLPPDLDLDPADFVATWNDENETRHVAEARLLSSIESPLRPPRW